MAIVREEIVIGSKADTRGFKKTESAAGKLNKTVKNLAATLGVALTGKALVSFGKNAVKAFAEDEKAATRLAGVVKNLGLEFENPAIASYIESLSRATAVADDQLRPAFQALISTTGSVAQSQKLLAQAIDISAGSGVDLATVSQDLANGYVGITKGLKKYNLGLTQTELKTKSFKEIQAKLNEQYKGSNQAFLGTYAGKMQALGVAAGEAQEKIGGALIDAAMLVSSSGDIDTLIGKIDTLASKVVGMIDRFSEGIAIIKAMLSAKTWSGMWKAADQAQVDAINARLRRTNANAWAGVDVPLTPAQLAAQKAAEAAARKRAAELAKITKANTAELKKQNALKKAASLFDMDQIQIIAALKGKVTEEERKRLELQLAILTGNEELASRLTYELAKSQGLGEGLAKYLSSLDFKNNPFASWEAYLDQLLEKARLLAIQSASTQPVQGNGSTARGASFASQTPVVQSLITNATGTNQAGVTAKGDVYITVQGNVVTEQELVAAVQNGLQLNSLSGAPSVIGRIAGMFG